jgi:hypothetical protein
MSGLIDGTMASHNLVDRARIFPYLFFAVFAAVFAWRSARSSGLLRNSKVRHDDLRTVSGALR